MFKKSDRKGLRTWVEIDSKALKHNYQTFKRLASGKKLMVVIKSNAYGHGLVACAEFFDSLSADWVGVDSVKEAVALRRDGIRGAILVLGYTLPENLKIASSKKIEVTVSNFETLRAIRKAGCKLSVHIKVDTGMHRQGFLPSEIDSLVLELKKMPQVKVSGLYTHLADSGNPKFKQRTKEQLREFALIKKNILTAGFNPICHSLATSGVLAWPNEADDLIRAGLGLYGLWPGKTLKKKLGNDIKLKPALTWKTIVGEIKTIDKGETVGYGFTEILKKKTKLAVCPIGYWHGYPRALSSLGEVFIKGKKVKVLGRVSMDMIVIDISTLTNVSVGDEVELVGKNISATYLADISGTISYEIITRINPLIKRFFV